VGKAKLNDWRLIMKVLCTGPWKGSPNRVIRLARAFVPVKLLLLACVVMPGGPAAAQGWMESAGPWIGGTAGTSGLGLEAGIRPADRLGVRLGLGWIPYEPQIDDDDITGAVSFPSPITRLTLDFFPAGGAFHVSTGLHRYSGGLTARARARDSVEINHREYTPDELGEGRGRVWGRETAPYLGIGWLGRTGRVRAYFDLGVAFTGSPLISVTVTGPIGNNPAFRSDLDAELRDREDSISSYRFLPHIAAGLRVGLGP